MASNISTSQPLRIWRHWTMIALLLGACSGDAPSMVSEDATPSSLETQIEALASAPAQPPIDTVTETEIDTAATPSEAPPPPDPEAEARARAEAAQRQFDADFPWHGVAYHFLSQVHQRANAASPVIGYMRRGSLLRGRAPVRGPGCMRGWSPLPEQGFVCRGNGFALGDTPQRFEAAPAPASLDADLPYPYAWVARDNIAQYWRLPSDAERVAVEAWIARQQANEDAALAATTEATTATETTPETGSANETLVVEDTESSATEGPLSEGNVPEGVTTTETPPSDSTDSADVQPSVAEENDPAEHTESNQAEPDLEAPPGLDEAPPSEEENAAPVDPAPPILRQRMRRGFYVSLDREQTHEGRTYFRTIRGGFVPADALTEAEPPSMRGVVIGGRWQLPIGFVYRGGVRGLERDAVSGRLSRSERIARLTPMPLSEQTITRQHTQYRVDIDGQIIRSDVMRIAEARPRPPEIPEGASWIHVDLDRQLLTAYEDETPVFVTMVSTGREGYQTPTGTFRIQSKHVSTTMDDTDAGEESYSIEDVPWTMYFEGSYALHGAFWHNRFGRVRSHGCVNLAPADARWLFNWSTPQLPSNWHGMRANRNHPGTLVHITNAAFDDERAAQTE